MFTFRMSHLENIESDMKNNILEIIIVDIGTVAKIHIIHRKKYIAFEKYSAFKFQFRIFSNIEKQIHTFNDVM